MPGRVRQTGTSGTQAVERLLRVPFASALARLPQRRAMDRFGISRADEVDPDGLFTLDTKLRGGGALIIIDPRTDQ